MEDFKDYFELDLEKAEKALSLLSQMDNLPCLPNITFPTLGGYVFWIDLLKVNGWRLQRNEFTGHCRVLDPDNCRRAWGGEKAVTELFRKILKE